MATKRLCLGFKEKEGKAMAKKGKCPEFWGGKAKAKTDVCTCCANLLQ